MKKKAVTGRPFPKGTSGNPRGRPPGGQSLAERVRAKVGDDGAALVDMLYAVTVSDDEPTRTRIEAAKLLLDRGFGRPRETVEVINEPEPMDLSKVSTETLRQLHQEMTGKTSGRTRYQPTQES